LRATLFPTFSGHPILTKTDVVIDARGHYIIPGAIDPHVHLELDTPGGRSADDFKTGTKAAIAGGTTTIIDFVTPGRNESLAGALKKRKAGSTKIIYRLEPAHEHYRLE